MGWQLIVQIIAAGAIGWVLADVWPLRKKTWRQATPALAVLALVWVAAFVAQMGGAA